jgi:hypothetical protein
MKQLYLTYCSPGEGLEQGRGQQLRAASAGLSDLRMRRLRAMMGYSIPNISSRDLTPETAPIRLAFLEDDSGDRVLVHARYVGEDPASGRLGNYFAHLLTDLPANVTARDAVLAWRSPSWTTSDDSGPKELPDVDQLPLGMLGDEQLFACVREESGRANYLKFIALLASAVLQESQRSELEQTGPTHHRPIFLLATPDDAAMLLYGATRIVPAALFRNLTFSLYDEIPETLTVLTAAQFTPAVTATWRPSNPAYELPDRFYTTIAVTLNLFNGRHTSLGPLPLLIADAVSGLAAGDLGAVDLFHTFCADLELTTLASVEVAYALVQGKTPDTLTADEMGVVAQSPALILYLAKDNSFFQRLLVLASDKHFRDHVFQAISDTLREHADVLISLASAAVAAGDQALLDAEVGQAKLMYQTILPMIDPSAAREAGQQLLARLTPLLAPALPREVLPLDARLAALEWSAADRKDYHPDQAPVWIDEWVNFTPVEVPQLLRRLQENVTRRHVASLALIRGVLTGEDLARLIAGADALLLAVYLELAQNGNDDLARRLLVAFAPPPGTSDRSDQATPHRLVGALQELASASVNDAVVGLAAAGPLLEDAANRITTLTFLLPGYATLIDWVDRHRPIIPETALSRLARDQYWAWNFLGSFIRSPRLSENVIAALPEAFARLSTLPEAETTELKRRVTSVVMTVLAVPIIPQPPQRQSTGRAVSRTVPLGAHPTLDQQMEALEKVLYAWGPTLGGSAMGWYCDMLMDVASWNEPVLEESLLPALVLLGLRGARTPELASILSPENIKPYLCEIISLFGRHHLHLLNRAAKSWPEALEEEWKLLATTNDAARSTWREGPRDLWRRLRPRR